MFSCLRGIFNLAFFIAERVLACIFVSLKILYPFQFMEKYDVIIVGGGPAGLQCARELSGSSLRVLLLEKNNSFGEKLCAGGLTRKGMDLLSLPDDVMEHKILRTSIHSRKRDAGSQTRVPALCTVDRKQLGSYQRSLLDGGGVEVKTASQVMEIEDSQVILKDGTRHGFNCLVGADGYASLVRRHLRLKTEKKLMGFQYTLPQVQEDPLLQIFLDARRFSSWYAWIFPHRKSIAVGFCCDPRRVDVKKIKSGFHDWLKEKGMDPGQRRLEAYPIGCDYRGIKFGNVFLVGEAAGMASVFTGEGIYQSLVSGHEVARMIQDPAYDPVHLKEALRYNRILERVLRLFQQAGPIRGSLQELLLILMNKEWLRKKINKQFTAQA
jgi:geranylgeranyl reductase